MVFRFIQIRFKENSNDSEYRPEIIFSIYSAPDAANPVWPYRVFSNKNPPNLGLETRTTLSCHLSGRSCL